MITEEGMAAVLKERGLLKRTEGVTGKEKIAWLTCDSRKVTEGTVFICKGAAFKEEYLAEAVKKGASSYISECSYQAGETLTGFIVTDIRKAMAAASAVFFGYVPGNLCVTGITGTKGKTTTAWYLKAMLDEWMKEQGGAATGLLSTIQNFDGRKWEDAVMTTPEAPVLHEFLAETVKNGLTHVTMEVSSQALKYKRVRELRFQVGIFLNISEDHISPVEHEDFEDYFSSKLSLFRQSETACINMDSGHRQRILKAARKAGRIVTFGRHPKADLRYGDVRMQEGGISFRVKCDRFSARFQLRMKGRFNIENAMAAIAAGYVYGIPVHCMQKALAETRVPGRMETFQSFDKKICGIVDFAHNRLSFEKLFDAVFQEYSSYKRIITVFGCPGGKALNRRRELGLIAGLFSDYVLITSDDPGTECQSEIAGEIRRYVEMTGCPCDCIEERRDAVSAAVRIAEQNKEKTMILLLGRGSEKYQKIGKASLDYPMDSILMQNAVERYNVAKETVRFSAAV